MMCACTTFAKAFTIFFTLHLKAHTGPMALALATDYGHQILNNPNILVDWANWPNKFRGLFGNTICSNFVTVYP